MRKYAQSRLVESRALGKRAFVSPKGFLGTGEHQTYVIVNMSAVQVLHCATGRTRVIEFNEAVVVSLVLQRVRKLIDIVV